MSDSQKIILSTIPTKSSMVIKHNALIRSTYDYSAVELKLILAIASLVHPKDEEFQTYSIKASEYAKLLGADKQNQFKSFNKLGRQLLSKPLTIPDENGDILCNWFSSYQYKDKEGRIECSFDPKLKPYMLQLKQEFTQYKVENVIKMKSIYAIRIYEIAKSWEGLGRFTLSVENMKKTFGISDKYTLYADFKRKVILKAIKEINLHSDLKISFKEIKQGRKVTSIRFLLGDIDFDDKVADDLSGEDLIQADTGVDEWLASQPSSSRGVVL